MREGRDFVTQRTEEPLQEIFAAAAGDYFNSRFKR
jgi:hypothetical protein